MQLHRLPGSGKWRQKLIANLRVSLIKGMLGQHIRRHLDSLLRIAVQVSLRRLPRVMRGIEAKIHKKRILPLSRLGQQMLDELIAVEHNLVLRSGRGFVQPQAGVQPLSFERLIPGLPIVPGARALISRAAFGRRREHPWGDRSQLLKAPLQHRRIQMPLATKVSGVSVPAQSLSPGGDLVDAGFRMKCA
jgi:hypothetical protein